MHQCSLSEMALAIPDGENNICIVHMALYFTKLCTILNIIHCLPMDDPCSVVCCLQKGGQNTLLHLHTMKKFEEQKARIQSITHLYMLTGSINDSV